MNLVQISLAGIVAQGLRATEPVSGCPQRMPDAYPQNSLEKIFASTATNGLVASL
jgi:hypothetical protein